MPELKDILACELRVHCVACRDKSEQGRIFRQSIINIIGGSVDFKCPHNITYEQSLKIKAGESAVYQVGKRRFAKVKVI